MGDFNFPRIDWNNYSAGVHSGIEMNFVNMVNDEGLVQHVLHPTRIQPPDIPSCLDLIFTGDGDQLDSLSFFEPMGCSDHLVLTARLRLPHNRPNRLPPYRNIWKADFQGMKQEAARINWSLPLDKSIDECWLAFKNKIIQLMDKYTPLSIGNISRRAPWFDKELKNLARRRKKLWKIFISTQRDTDYRNYKTVRNQFNREKLKKRHHFERSLIDSAGNAPKRIFRYVNQRLKPDDRLPALTSETGEIVTSDIGRAQLLALHFSSVFHEVQIPFYLCSTVNDHSIVYNEYEVKRTMQTLNTKSSPGPDGIHPLILKNLAAEISGALTDLFNKSLMECALPQEWKDGVIKALPKAGDHSLPTNYRPICLTPVVAKVMETLIKGSLMSFMHDSNLLDEAQHGFRKQRSCTTNLLLAHHSWLNAINRGLVVDVVLVDFSKAFDKVDHFTLLKKLENYGIHTTLLCWIRSFLYGRRWRVKVNECFSEWHPALSGVPQGTVLGPILFMIYINELSSIFNSQCVIYADDLKIWRIIETDEDRQRLQDDLDVLNRWSEEHHLPINPSKCQLLTLGRSRVTRQYTLAGKPLTSCNDVKDLGLFTRCDLKTLNHTDKIYRSSLNLLWALKRSFSYWNNEMVTCVYSALVRPKLEFGSPVYFPLTKMEEVKLEKVQHLATRMIPTLRCLAYDERCRRLNLFTLKYRRLRMDLIFVFRIICLGHFPSLRSLFTLANAPTRGHDYKLVVTRMDGIPHKRCFERRVINSWNSLPTSVVSVNSIEEFKKRLDAFYADHCYYETF